MDLEPNDVSILKVELMVALDDINLPQCSDTSDQHIASLWNTVGCLKCLIQ
jgi:hypothetical protein